MPHDNDAPSTSPPGLERQFSLGVLFGIIALGALAAWVMRNLRGERWLLTMLTIMAATAPFVCLAAPVRLRRVLIALWALAVPALVLTIGRPPLWEALTVVLAVAYTVLALQVMLLATLRRWNALRRSGGRSSR